MSGSFTEKFIDSFSYLHTGTSLFTTPYHSGLSIDSIETKVLPTEQRDLLISIFG